jgi:hypothetical protein
MESVDERGIPMTIIQEARKDPLIGPRVIISSTRREPLRYEGQIVGFVTPHETQSGWRLGPIFVLPAYRAKGLVQAYYAAHPHKTFVAFIPDGCAASMRAHKLAGFVRWKAGRGGVWLRRDPR